MSLWVPTYRTIDVPVYGNPSEVDQMEIEVNPPPEPTDWRDECGYPGETPYPEHEIAGIDYDVPLRYAHPSIPADCLA